jgi:purine-binding chemotaxis protein CheW
MDDQTILRTSDTLLLSDGIAHRSQLMVTCRLGPQHYGLPIEAVREVVRLPALLSLAGAPPYVCGMLNMRGNYLPVLDGRILIGEPATYDLSNQVILAGHDTPEVGLLVDEVLEVQTLDLSRWTPLHHQAASFLQGVINTARGSVVLFDLDALLALVPSDA